MISSLLATALFAGIGYSSFWEPYQLSLEQVIIRSGAFSATPNPITILHLSDLHFKRKTRRECKALAHRKKLQPDLIVFTGDWTTKPERTDDLCEFVAEMVGGVPAFGVWGNLERWCRADLEQLKKDLGRAGVTILVNGWQQILIKEKRVTIVGVDDPHYSFDRLTEASVGAEPADISILLAHSPIIRHKLQRAQFTLVLCGHTHGGQICIPLIGPLTTATDSRFFAHGLFTVRECPIYINRGMGTALLPVRFRCKPEMALIQVEA